MAINFLKILNNQSNDPEAIAEQIVALEQKQIEYKKQHGLLRDQAKALRQQKLCGEAIADEQVKDADRKAENAILDLEAVSEGIVKLEEKLRATYESIRDNGQNATAEGQNALLPERNRLCEELARSKAELLVVAEQLFGKVKTEERLRSGSIFEADPDTDPLMKKEEEKLRTSVKQPTYYKKISEVQSYGSWASALNVNDEVQRVLDKHRRNMAAPLKEKL